MFQKVFQIEKLHWDCVYSFELQKILEILMKMSEIEHYPFETPLHEIYDEEICLSPIPSLAMHCTNVNSVFGLSPNINWKKLWDENK